MSISAVPLDDRSIWKDRAPIPILAVTMLVELLVDRISSRCSVHSWLMHLRMKPVILFLKTPGADFTKGLKLSHFSG